MPGVLKLIGMLKYIAPSELGPSVNDGPTLAEDIPLVADGAPVLCIVNVQCLAEDGQTPDASNSFVHGATYSVQVSSASVGGNTAPVV